MSTTPDPLELAQRLRLGLDRMRRSVRATRPLGDVAPRHEAALSLLRRKGPLSTAELARREQITPQSMGATVLELVERGWVVKHPDATDGRRELVELTDAGRAVDASVRERRDQDLSDLVFGHLTPEQLVLVEQVLTLFEDAGEKRDA